MVSNLDSLFKLSLKYAKSKDYIQAIEICSQGEDIVLSKFDKSSVIYGRCCLNRGIIFDLKNDLIHSKNHY